MTDTLRAVEGCVSPSRPVGWFASREARKPYFTHLITPRAAPQHLLAVSDTPALLLFDKSHLAKPVRTIPLHADQNITGITNVEHESIAWAGSSLGGYVALWDARSAQADAMHLPGPSGAPYLSVANSGPLIAAGTELKGADAVIDLWDLRNSSAPVYTYSEVHSDDIMSLTFHQDTEQHPGVLLSGGMDGLVSTIDTRLAAEEDAVISVGNTDSSLARVGFATHAAYAYTPRTQATDVDMDEKDIALCRDPRRTGLGPIYAISNMQTLGVWDADKLDSIVSDVSVRAPTSYRPAWATDYVVDAGRHLPMLPPASGVRVPLMVGDQEGGAAILGYDVDLAGTVMDWSMYVRLPSAQTSEHAHSDIVRSVAWDAGTQRLFTGGEDGCVLAWALDMSTPEHSAPVPDASALPTQGQSAGRARSTGTKKRFAPYP
ncbi:hypothetical protein MOBT1_001141 [Malassezia obtusa]|uniref:Uncharacterized protein n=1 Tax=Malassezia obtusa TaxID=76774 RepID=A0AAF0E3F7_9BASI|nr:hypothetical protein MOBT1_001141 [Malassezia obtusa]